MPVPASVKQLLDNQKIEYGVAALPVDTLTNQIWHDQHLRNTGAAKSQILQDSEGRVQVVIPANGMLDLAAVNRVLKRDLRATSNNELRKFYEKHQLDSIPALPRLAGLPTLVDQRLLEPESLLLDSGTADQLLQMKQEDFRQTLNDVNLCDITIPLSQLEIEDNTTNDEEQIIGAVRDFTNLRIKQRLEETLELPPLPETAQRIIKLRVDPNADISDLANIVETDPSLAAQVVSWAASPYYSAPGKIKSIHDAIVRVLGFDMVLNLALGLALGKTLSMPKDDPNGSTPYWKMAVYTAATVEGLVTAIPRDHRPGFGMAYLSGLLHNFGYLVMSEVFPPHFSQICRYMEANPHVHYQAIERHLLNITREQLSSWLMELWNMPEEVVVALRQQGNEGYEGEYAAYSKLIFVAQRLLRQRGIGIGPKLEVPAHIYEELHLDPEKAYATLDNIMESSEELDNIAAQLAPA